MVESLPTGSITGQQDGEWNRLYADRRSRPSAKPGPSHETPPGEPPAPSEVQALQTELDRKERQLEYVISHYERLLHEKNDRLAENADAGATADRWTAVLSHLRRLVARW